MPNCQAGTSKNLDGSVEYRSINDFDRFEAVIRAIFRFRRARSGIIPVFSGPFPPRFRKFGQTPQSPRQFQPNRERIAQHEPGELLPRIFRDAQVADFPVSNLPHYHLHFVPRDMDNLEGVLKTPKRAQRKPATRCRQRCRTGLPRNANNHASRENESGASGGKLALPVVRQKNSGRFRSIPPVHDEVRDSLPACFRSQYALPGGVISCLPIRQAGMALSCIGSKTLQPDGMRERSIHGNPCELMSSTTQTVRCR